MIMDRYNHGDGSEERGCGMRRYKSRSARTVAPVLVLALLAQSFYYCKGSKENSDPQPNISFDREITAASTNFPRILTVLTTYNGRTPFIKAYREAAADEADGFEPFNKAVSRYDGQFDWIAAGDDDTVFLYRRAMAFLRNIDHTQQKHNASDMRAVKGCCLDFTRPCEVPVRPEASMNGSALEEFLRNGVFAYQNDFFWPYGGTGFFLSAGLIKTVQGSEDGWDLCREMFDEENTDVQVARCLVAHGLTISSFRPGFYTPVTADPEELREYLASNCQVIGVHAGIRHLEDDAQYTLDKFKSAISALWDEDKAQPWLTDGYLATGCPQTWEALMTWK